MTSFADLIAVFRSCFEDPKFESGFSLLLWIHFSLFLSLLFLATVGKAFGIRKKYIRLLDALFNFAASKLDGGGEDVPEETEGEDLQEAQEDHGVIISPEAPSVKRPNGSRGHFHFKDAIPYLSVGMQSVVEDSVNRTFSPGELQTWNMLSRTKNRYKRKKSRSLTSLWVLGFLFRYVFLVPVRLVILAISISTLVSSTLLVGRLSEGPLKRRLNGLVVSWCLDFLANALSVLARFHDKQNRPLNGIAVANHTSPLDSLVLATDNCYDMVGQVTGGFLGIFMKALSKCSTHIWFERNCSRQRSEVSKRLLSHSQNEALPPLLLFPEGICVNNTAVFLFRKGVFEIDTKIYPIAIKFDIRYGDAYWYDHGFFAYCLSLMTSWALVCDVWYLPPMRRDPDESPIEFANRVKSAIASKGGLDEIAWDGAIKLMQTDKEKKNFKERIWLNRQQLEFARHLMKEE